MPADYYIDICNGPHSTTRNCLSHNMHPQVAVHPGHGIGIKDAHSGAKGGYAASGTQGRLALPGEFACKRFRAKSAKVQPNCF